MKNGAVWLSGLAVLAVIGLITFGTCIHYIDNYELGYTFDKFSGKVAILDRTGLFIRPRWRYGVHSIDLRPAQLQIAANNRVLNAKLVQFNTNGFKEFVAWHGVGAGDDAGALHEILKAYAFNVNNGSDCPFLSIVDKPELHTNQPAGTLAERSRQ
jgi:hypothetical protein